MRFFLQLFGIYLIFCIVFIHLIPLTTGATSSSPKTTMVSLYPLIILLQCGTNVGISKGMTDEQTTLDPCNANNCSTNGSSTVGTPGIQSNTTKSSKAQTTTTKPSSAAATSKTASATSNPPMSNNLSAPTTASNLQTSPIAPFNASIPPASFMTPESKSPTSIQAPATTLKPPTTNISTSTASEPPTTSMTPATPSGPPATSMTTASTIYSSHATILTHQPTEKNSVSSGNTSTKGKPYTTDVTSSHQVANASHTNSSFASSSKVSAISVTVSSTSVSHVTNSLPQSTTNKEGGTGQNKANKEDKNYDHELVIIFGTMLGLMALAIFIFCVYRCYRKEKENDMKLGGGDISIKMSKF